MCKIPTELNKLYLTNNMTSYNSWFIGQNNLSNNSYIQDSKALVKSYGYEGAGNRYASRARTANAQTIADVAAYANVVIMLAVPSYGINKAIRSRALRRAMKDAKRVIEDYARAHPGDIQDFITGFDARTPKYPLNINKSHNSGFGIRKIIEELGK